MALEKPRYCSHCKAQWPLAATKCPSCSSVSSTTDPPTNFPPIIVGPA